MRKKAFLGVGAALLIVSVPVVSARAKNKDASFYKKLSSDKKIIHALNRLTFGPRAGDVGQVRSAGLKKWMDLQLHPERIQQNPTLEAKLRPLDTLRMQTVEMARRYPPPQVIRAMASGRVPYPGDPEERKIMERLAERYQRRLKQQQPEPRESLYSQAAQLFTRDQMRVFRNGAPEEKLQLLFSLPEEQQEKLLEVMPQPARREILAKAPVEVRRKFMRSFAPQELIAHDLNEGKLYRAIYSNHQLEEVLADFWYNHFNVYLDKGADRYLVTSYERDAIRPHVLGKFKDLLRATAEHPAMLFYLDNWQSVDPQAAERMRRGIRRPALPGLARRGLNENYARELLELHTLGVDGGYTQQDIIEVARCFTGWTIRDPRGGATFVFDERMHDPGEKTVLGVKIPAGGGIEDGLKVLDIVVHHPSTARFVSRKLAQRFVADDPPDSLVEKMAKTFRKTNGDIREALKTMLASTEFWSEGAYRTKVKSPLEMIASAVRAVNAEVDFAAALAQQLAQLGQPLYRKSEPTGYPNVSEEWVNSTALLGRMNFAQALAANKLPGVRVDTARLAGGKQDPVEIARTLLLSEVSEQTRAAITKEGEASPVQVAGLVIGSPDFQRR